jgi:hypothetical protein
LGGRWGVWQASVAMMTLMQHISFGDGNPAYVSRGSEVLFSRLSRVREKSARCGVVMVHTHLQQNKYCNCGG